MKGSTTNATPTRKPSTTSTTASSITTYSVTRPRQGEVYEDYTEVRLYYIYNFLFKYYLIRNSSRILLHIYSLSLFKEKNVAFLSFLFLIIEEMGCSNAKSALIDEKRVSVFAQFIQEKK
jgi:hypothetical protein